jgi:hypothetical protein
VDDFDEAMEHLPRKSLVMTCPRCKRKARFVVKKVLNPFAERDPTAVKFFLAMACTLCGKHV